MFVSGVIMMYIYLRIFILSQKHSRQIAAVQISSCSGPRLKKSMFIIPSKESLEKQTSDQGKEDSSVQPQSHAPQEVPNPHITHERRPEVRNKPSRRALVTTMAILGAFYLCWSPLLIFLVAFKVTTTMNLTTYYLALVTQLNSIFNPIVYGIRNPDIREALQKMFRCRN
ncbi:5-hydroxytryptamine receptor 1F-like [Argopecten irradians]|uniref:5-hydroxytryptamine receptor 1F-like n=1 Tax=Argopecten irradians TaxID=31199 RepID=UPI003711520E